MRKLILKISLSADGFVGGPNGEIDWLFRTLDDKVIRWIEDTLWQAGVHIMGSHTFHDMASYWPASAEPLAAPMNEIPKLVFSRKGFLEPTTANLTTNALKSALRIRSEKSPGSEVSPNASGWDKVTVVCGDLTYEISRLKHQDGKFILAHGGAGFARALVEEGLIDEYRLLIHPILLGSGLPLFSSLSKPTDLKLQSSTVFNSGIIANIYTSISN
jgi:dihydrofolate reductase